MLVIIRGYPLVNVQHTMDRSIMFNGNKPTIIMAMFNSDANLPEGAQHDIYIYIHKYPTRVEPYNQPLHKLGSLRHPVAILFLLTS